jgi:hypothetical protein
VVARTLQTFHASGLEHPAIEQLPDSELRGKATQDCARYSALAERFLEMLIGLKKKGVTLR